MAKSVIFPGTECCVICGKPYPQTHHIFYGTSNRKKSDKLGFVMPLCLEHHTGTNGIHFNKKMDMHYKALAQAYFERNHTREQFIELFGKSYI